MTDAELDSIIKELRGDLSNAESEVSLLRNELAKCEDRYQDGMEKFGMALEKSEAENKALREGVRVLREALETVKDDKKD